jgi:predicted HicB family RNase H-like nuclease
MKTTIITLRLDSKLLEQCKRLAKKQKITLNEFIIQALTEFIKQQKAENVRPI